MNSLRSVKSIFIVNCPFCFIHPTLAEKEHLSRDTAVLFATRQLGSQSCAVTRLIGYERISAYCSVHLSVAEGTFKP